MLNPVEWFGMERTEISTLLLVVLVLILLGGGGYWYRGRRA